MKKKKPQIDIRKKLIISNKLFELYKSKFHLINNHYKLDLNFIKKFINELCRCYNIPKIKRVFVNMISCRMLNANAFYSPVGRIICFKNEEEANIDNIFHEFAHHLDQIWNPGNQITVDSKTKKCNQEVADEFSHEFYFKLWRKHVIPEKCSTS